METCCFYIYKIIIFREDNDSIRMGYKEYSFRDFI